MGEFKFQPSPHVPFRDTEAIARCRAIKREDIAKHKNPEYRIHVVKDADEIVNLLQPQALSLTFVPVADHAHHDPSVLAERFGGTASESLADAMAHVPEPRLIAGSLYLVGEALAEVGELPD